MKLDRKYVYGESTQLGAAGFLVFTEYELVDEIEEV